MAAQVKNVFRKVNRVNNMLLPQFENLKQRKLGKKAYTVFVDYKTVFKEFYRHSKEKPLRSLSTLATLLGLYYVYDKNPDAESYHDAVLGCANELLQLSHLIRNPSSDKYVQQILEFQNQRRLRVQSLGLLSVVWVSEFGPHCDLYEKHCPYVQPRWFTLPQRIIDVGFHGRWFFLDKAMKDYDVNEAELADCPPD